MDLELLKLLAEFGIAGLILFFWWLDRKSSMKLIQSQGEKMLKAINNNTEILSSVKTFLEAKLS